MRARQLAFVTVALFFSCQNEETLDHDSFRYKEVSGVYPHLAFYNSQGECGTGAVVPWAGDLWAITYSPHFPNGSNDKLYRINQQLDLEIFPKSLGGTPANRMIHRESQQLFIGPYAIDSSGHVRCIQYELMPGRHTGNARHLQYPDSLIYYATMEEGFYEVNVTDLSVTTLYPDGNKLQRPGDMAQHASLLPGAHGKGLYSGQGVLVYANNGEASQEALRKFDIPAGCLAEWDGSKWTVVRRNQFMEVTGPGGIHGNANPEKDPIWATGFDHKSLLVGLREYDKGWTFFRLPKASHCYDGAHGWNTEWPRIRNIGSEKVPDYLMTHHGMFWRFPASFSSTNTRGIRPRSAYLKVIGDFTRWNDRLVFGCDDSARREFLNKRKAKGNIEGPGQSNSNLWFTDLDKPDQLGPTTASGAIWLEETVEQDLPSEPFLIDGWQDKGLWIKNHGNTPAEVILEVDVNGVGAWREFERLKINPKENVWHELQEKGTWIRATLSTSSRLSLILNLSMPEPRETDPGEIFEGILLADNSNANGGLLYGLGNNKRALGLSARDSEGKVAGYYELDSALTLSVKADDSVQSFIEERFTIPKEVVTVEASSVLIVDDSGRRWRLPKGESSFDALTSNGELRICREVATERDLFNCHGTFYELPAENADGYAKIRPIASHPYKIHDYASYRGLLVMSGVDPKFLGQSDHVIISNDQAVAIWVGVIDDLWQLGKPTGEGGPWLEEQVENGAPSDPYLIGFYDQRSVKLYHNAKDAVEFTLEVNPLGHGPWLQYKSFSVPPGENLVYQFPDSFESRWVRLRVNEDCQATAWFSYK